jgi:hypothetical protein
MKLILLFSLILSPIVFAEENPAKAERFQKVKEMALERVSTKMNLLEQNKSCISSASSREDLKSCRKAGKASHKQMKEEFKAKRMAFKNSKKK